MMNGFCFFAAIKALADKSGFLRFLGGTIELAWAPRLKGQYLILPLLRLVGTNAEPKPSKFTIDEN
jgi:hypothetical protein